MTVTAHPCGTANADLPAGHVIDTVHRRIVVAFPDLDDPRADLAIEA